MASNDPFGFVKTTKLKQFKQPKHPKIKMPKTGMGGHGGGGMHGSVPTKSKSSHKKQAFPKITFNVF
jgi:hypothetical protein